MIAAKTKAWAREGLLLALWASGILGSTARRRLSGGTSVLAFHRVLSPPERKCAYSSPAIVVDTEIFESRLRFLRENYFLLGLGDFLAIAEGTMPCPDQAVMITFDDGWKDNYTNAFPVLRSLSIPATVFLSSSYIDSDKTFWQEEMCQLIDTLCLNNPESIGRVSLPMRLAKIGTLSRQRRVQAIREYIGGLKRQGYEYIEDTLQSLRQSADEIALDLPIRDKFMSWADVREMADAGIDFGSHTVSHRMLDKLSNGEALRELVDSKERIESETGRPVRSLAYPNGNYSNKVMELAGDAGYEAAFSMDPGVYSFSSQKLMQIERTNIHDGKLLSSRRLVAAMCGLG